MLVLTRKLEESIIIDGNIEIKIVEIEDGRVRIGIDAPKDVEILRKELYDSVGKENKETVQNKIKITDILKLKK